MSRSPNVAVALPPTPAPADVPPGTTVPATRDLFLDGRFAVLQPVRGHHRSGADALLLAAAVDAATVGTVVDLGAGAGVAGMAVAARCSATTVTLAEIEPELAALARAAVELPENAGLAGRVTVAEGDVTSARGRAAAGLTRQSAGTVILNPPYRTAGRVRVSPNAARAGAHVLGEAGLDPWLRAAADLLAPGGRVAAIFPAEGLAAVLDSLAGRFGAVSVMPVHPRAGEPAIRVVVRAIKGRRSGLTLLDRLVLHEADGRFTAEAAAIFRDGAGLAD